MKQILAKIKPKKRELTLRESYRLAVRMFRTHLKVSGWRFVARFILVIIEVCGGLFATYIGSRILGELILSVAANQATANLYKFAVLEAFIFVLVSIASGLGGLLYRIMLIKWDEWFYLTLSECRANLDTDYFEDRNNQKLLSKVAGRGAYTISQFSDEILYVFHNILKMVLIIGSLIVLSPILVLVIVLATVPKALVELKKAKLSWNIWHTKGDEFYRHAKTLRLFEHQKDLIEIKLYGLKTRLIHGVAAKNYEKFASAQIKAVKSTFFAQNVATTLYQSALLGSMIYLLKNTVSGILSIANFSFYSGILIQFSTSLSGLVSLMSSSNESLLYARDFYQLLDEKSKIASPSKGAIKISKNSFPQIEFKDVGFAYRSNPEEYVIRNFNLIIKPGEHIALVGENGAGKSTLVKLLLRLYDVTEGVILVDGINIKDLDLDTYWRQIGVLFQDFIQYPFDIKTNIEFGSIFKKSTKQEVDRSVELANLKPILKKLPKGINTLLDNSFEDGVEPSGGQWQRVALARAFYRNSNILILDEPTAAVDANAEYEIFNNIFKHYGDKTAIIISHRFSTVKRAERIVVLEKGKVLEEGTHKKLMFNSKLYAEMFNKQAEGYLE